MRSSFKDESTVFASFSEMLAVVGVELMSNGDSRPNDEASC